MDKFIDNQDFEEQLDDETDGWLLSIAQRIKEEDSRVMIMNPEPVKQFLIYYQVLKRITNKSAIVTYEMNSPLKSMGVISVLGSNISFSNTKALIELARLSSNFEVYPKTDGNIQMDFTFYGLSSPIE